MSTMEKVLIQIFERKNRIIDHVKQQILVFDHHLASKCLIDGFVPPSWLLSNSPSELNKEDLISELLFPYQEPSIPYCSLYQQPVVTTDNVRLPDVSCTGVDAFHEGLDQCLSGKADELDPTVTSPPQDCRDQMISDICPDPGLSLARIQRSKSRQRALEHRNSAKSCKNVESSEKNGDACDSRDKGSKIACLRSDTVDKLEFIRSDDDAVSCEEEREKCWSKERSENVYSGRITRSRSSVQPSKSVNGALGVDDSCCVVKQHGVVCAESISKSRQQPGVDHELLGSEFVEPIHDTVSCPVTNEERGRCRNNERGEDIYSGTITRSRSSSQPPKSVNAPPSADNSFCTTNQDGIVLTDSINKSRLQPEAAGELLQFVQPVDNVVTCIAAKKEGGECMSNERSDTIYSDRITRSRSCVQSPKSNGLSRLGKTSDVVNQDGNLLIEFISESKQQPNLVGELLESVKPAIISDESSGSRKARDPQSKEKENNVYQGRITRSRSSSLQYNHVDKHLKLDSCPDRGINVQPARTFDITNESCGIKAKTSDYQKDNPLVDQHNNGSTTRANLSENLLKLVDSFNTLGYEVTQSKPADSNKSPYAKLSDRSEEVVLKQVSGTRVISLPYANDSELADLNQCDAIVADTDADSDNSVESHSASSASNLDAANNPPLVKSSNRYERFELESVVKSPHSESAMMVMPKQLDFDNLGECNLNEASGLISQSEEEIEWLEKGPATPLSSADKLDEVPSVQCQEKYNLSLEKQLPEELEVCSKEEKQSETELSKTSGLGTASNFSVVFSVKEALEASADAATIILPESHKISQQKIFLDNHSSNFKVANENFLRNSPKDALWSNLNADSGMSYQFEKEQGKVEVVESVTSATEASNHVQSGPAILSDNDFTGACSPGLLRKADAVSGNAIERRSVALSEETKGHSAKQKMESSPSQNPIADSRRRSIDDTIDSVPASTHAKSSEHKITIPFTQPGRHSGSRVMGWPHKRRKIDGQQSNSLSLSLSPKEENVMQLNTDKCLVDEEDFAEGKRRWKERDRSQNTYSTFMHKKFDVVSVSSLPQETLEDYDDHSVEGTAAVDLSGIRFNLTRQCTADENQILLNILDKSEFGKTEHLTCDKRSKQESKSQLGEDGENLSCPISSLCQPPTDLMCADQTGPELEGFILQTDSEQIRDGGDALIFDKLDLPKTTIERASILEQLCKSACIHTPLSHFPTTYRLHQPTDLHQSVPNGLLECLDLRSNLPNNDDGKGQFKVSHSSFGEDVKHACFGGSFSDCLPFSSSQVAGDVKKPYLSPVGKLWDRIISRSGSSDERGSLNPELPCISEENENTDQVVDAFQEGSASKVAACSIKRKPLAEIRECPDASASVSGAEIFTFRDSLDSVNTAYSFTGTKNGVKQKIGKENASKRIDTNKMKENLSIPQEANPKRASESLRNRFSKPKLSGKTSLRKGGPSFSQKEARVNNIVSNVTSFIPIVQQKQTASIITGKRDIKVKALEAAEAAKQLAEKKEKDRKMRKEAMKLERARLEQENLRQLELEKKKKEQERKKKEADMAAKKRQREEEERLEKERKRRRMEEARRQQRAPEEKLCAKKDDKEKKCQAMDPKAQTMKVPNDEAVNREKLQKEIATKNEGKMLEMEYSTVAASTSVAEKNSTTGEDCNAKVMSTADRSKQNDNAIANKSLEQSYDISPYKGSDDEDEEDEDDDDQPNRKFIPSWASKKYLAPPFISQQKVNPEKIFPPKSFCSVTVLLLPRKLQQNRAS